MVIIVELGAAKNKNKKFMVRIDGKTIQFGASGYEDYTEHHDDERKEKYIKRHRDKENWGKNGIKTAGFWSRWMLWNKKTKTASLKDLERRFGVEIVPFKK